MRTLATLALLTVGASMSLAQSAAGNWKGKIQFKMPPIPANAPPQQKEMMTKMAEQLRNSSLLLTLKADKTFTIKMSGMPGMPASQATQTGKWSQSGKTVTMTGDLKPGQTKANPPQSMTLSPNGRTMNLTMPGGQGSVTFTRS